jgi:xanthine dehydrogenase accessory factor
MSSLTARAVHATAQQWVAASRPALVVIVEEIKGSTPRGTGTRMLVSLDAVDGTIGGGHLEWQAISLARQALSEAGQSVSAWSQTFPLGPTLGQCCGGVVSLRFEPLGAAALQAWVMPPPRFHLELHGAGHVGQALIKLLADLDCTVRWIDERADDLDGLMRGASASALHPERQRAAPGMPEAALLASLPSHITWLPTDAADQEVADAPPQACHLVLTHRHDLDLRIVTAVLRRGDFHFAGMIGSMSKRAKFHHRLAELGISPDTLARLSCPIGLPELPGKEPAVIAISVMAQLLQHTALPLPN